MLRLYYEIMRGWRKKACSSTMNVRKGRVQRLHSMIAMHPVSLPMRDCIHLHGRMRRRGHWRGTQETRSKRTETVFTLHCSLTHDLRTALERNSVMAEFNELLPEEADVQDQRLIHDLRRMYRTDTQTIEHLARVRHRLPINDDSSVNDRESRQQHDTPPAIQQVQSSTRNAKHTRFAVAAERSSQRRLGVLAAVLLTALLVGSLLLVLSLARRSSQGTPGNTLHPSKLAGGSGSLISLQMIDLTTGWALSEHAVLRTTDGGLQWKNVTPPNTRLTRESSADFLTASLAWVTTPQTNGTTTQILRTTDGGQTWQQSTIQATFLKQITFIDSQHGWILSGWGATGGAAE